MWKGREQCWKKLDFLLRKGVSEKGGRREEGMEGGGEEEGWREKEGQMDAL